MKVKIDSMLYDTKRKALSEMKVAIAACEGSEQERMLFAYYAVLDGYTDIDTYREVCGYLYE